MTNLSNNSKYSWRLVLALFCLVSMVAEAGNLFRYRNSEGNLVIDHQVPPEYISKGYEVLSSTGRVVETVPPHQPVEAEEGTVSDAASQADQLKEDQFLLRSYSDAGEIDAAGERRLEQLAREIEIIESNRAKNAEQLERARARAVRHQLAGEKIPEALLARMDEVTGLSRDAQQMLLLRRQEYDAVAARYERYKARFRTLNPEKIPSQLPTTAPASSPSATD
ncbi:hypothetical protein [Porticoccus sp.]|uniref:hypothetical protein n=1 Tax=Porticoccus sp. TaxID=2024853 RepID=UPI003F6A06E5